MRELFPGVGVVAYVRDSAQSHADLCRLGAAGVQLVDAERTVPRAVIVSQS